MTARLAPLAPPYLPEVAEDLAKLMPPGMVPLELFRTVAHNPRVLRRLRRGALLDPGAISLRERELVILRTTARCGSEYEWGVHVAFFGGAAGFTPAELVATVRGDAHDPVWSPRERLLVAAVDELHGQARLSDELYARLGGALDPSQLIEVLMLVGQYHAISFLTNATGVALEPGAPRFPHEAL